MSTRRDIATSLILIALVITPAAPLRARDSNYYSPFLPGSTLRQGDVLRSGEDCLELHFNFTDGYFNRLDLRGSGAPGCGNTNWDSYSDFDWQGFGNGIHVSSNEPRGRRAAEAVMQTDGNFVVYDIEDGVPVAVWSTHTEGNPGAYLNVQGDGNMVIYSATNDVLWSLF